MVIIIRIVYMIICLLIAYYINVILHELGHAVFGIITGYNLYGIQVGKRLYIKNVHSEKWNMSICENAGYMGRCLMMPKKTDNIKDYPFVLFLAGGIIVNSVVMLSCIPLIMITMDNKSIVIPIVMLFLTALFLLMGNALPLKDEKTGMGTDGYSILNMMKSADVRKCSWCCSYIEGHEYAGSRLKHIPEEYYLQYENCNIEKLGVSELKYYHAEYLIDCAFYEAAAKKIDELIAEKIILGADFERLKCERIWLALLMGELESIELLYDESLKKFINDNRTSDFKAMRVLYKFSVLKEDVVTSQNIMYKFEELCSKYPISGRIVMEKDLMFRTI